MQKQLNSKSKALINPNDLQMVWKIVTKNWYLPIIFCTLSFGVAYVYVSKLVDIYGASAQILLKSNETYQAKSVIGFDYGQFQETSNQMKVIKSANLIKTVVSKLDMDVSYFLVGRLKTTEVYKGVPFRIKVLNSSTSLYGLPIKFKILSTKKYKISYDVNGKQKEIEGFFDKDLITNDFKLNVQSTGIINEFTIDKTKELDYFFKIINPAKLVSKYSRDLGVTNEEYTNILALRIEDEIPERAVAFLDTLCQEYIDYSLQSQIAINDNTVKYIDKQLDEIIYILDSIETYLENFKDDKAILNLGREEGNYYSKLDSYDSEINIYDLQIEALNDLENYIIEKKDPELLPPSIYVNSTDGFLKSAVSELYNLQMNRNSALYDSKEENLSIDRIDSQIEKLKGNLLVYLSNLRIAIKQKIEGLKDKYGQYYASLKTLPKKQRALLNITRKQQVNEKMYMFLLEKRATAIIARANIISDKKVIESPRSIGVVKPKKSKIYNMFLIVGFLFSALIIAIRTMFFSRIESYNELKAISEYPIWGEILFSDFGKSNYIVIEEDLKSPLTESFRTVRTNLDYVGSINNESGKVVLVTSNSPGEGKTFCSVNLAAILAKGNKKVLVLEFDLHKPKVQIALNMKSDKGLSLLLAGKENITDCILSTHIENLDVILSGPIPPNPSDLILSIELQKIIQHGVSNYDYVIIDTPPLGLISDSLILMKHADIVMFVLNPKLATKEIVKDVTEVIENNKIENFGFLLNGVKRKSSKYYYNKYAYGYGYGYGKNYGYGYRSKK